MQKQQYRSQSLSTFRRSYENWWALALSLFATSVVAMSVPSVALAQDIVNTWPVKPVMIILPLTPGSGVETEARLYTQKMGETLGKSFVMDSKPGGATTIATAYVAKAPLTATRY